MARSQIFTNCAEADQIRARFSAQWGRAAAASLVEGTTSTVLEEAERGDAGKAQRVRVLTTALLALLCGTCCQLCVELLLRFDGRTGNIISACEYTYCALLSSSALLQPRTLPWRYHVSLWFAGVMHSALTNTGLAVKGLPMPVALVIKNGSLLANMLLGSLVVGKHPSRRELLAAAIISVGLIFGTLGKSRHGGADVGAASAGAYALGIGCLGGALLARAASGIVQEAAFTRHGVAYNEVLFWRAVLGAPVFLAANFGGHLADEATTAPTVLVEVMSSGWLMLLLAANVIGDHITKLAVTHLINEAGSFSATLVIQLQRFVSCVFSATVLAEQPPPPTLWLAIGLVALGSLASIKW